MNLLIFLALVLVFVGVVGLYIRMAQKRAIVDVPNERSSHSQVAIRGGGVVFPLAWVLFSFINHLQFPFFTLGLIGITLVSFADDIRSLSSQVRLLVHLAAITLLFYQLGLFHMEIWTILSAYIFCVGILNAINFMDGINGITGLYGLSFFIPIFIFSIDSIEQDSLLGNPLGFVIASILAFGFYNFRKRAKCFAGDVGSVSLAFLIVFYLIVQIFQVNLNKPSIDTVNISLASWKYLLMLSLYGVDSILTIIQRIWLKENIFKAHRRHLYQYLSNELEWPHLLVASLYAVIQFAINIWVFKTSPNLLQSIILLGTIAMLYTIMKVLVIRRVNLEKANRQ